MTDEVSVILGTKDYEYYTGIAVKKLKYFDAIILKCMDKNKQKLNDIINDLWFVGLRMNKGWYIEEFKGKDGRVHCNNCVRLEKIRELHAVSKK